MTDEALPCDEAKIIFRWVPPEPRNPRPYHDDVADEYIVEREPEACSGGVILYGKYHGEWHANVSGRPVIAELLRRNEVADAEIEWLKGQLKNDPAGPRACMCVYCGKAVIYDPSEGIQAAIDVMRAHDKECEQNPLANSLRTVRQAYDQFKHLDSILSDPSWGADYENDSARQAWHVTHELYAALKAAVTEQKPTTVKENPDDSDGHVI